MLDRVATAQLELEETKPGQNEDSGQVSGAPRPNGAESAPKRRTKPEPVPSSDGLPEVTSCSKPFDWSSDEDIVIRQQREIAIYANPHRQVVIRERGDIYDEDEVIIISAEHVPDVLDALKMIYDEII